MPTDSQIVERANALLPSNATAAERAMSLSTARAARLPAPHRTLWDPQTCPLDVLPWLAWALSVDEWDAGWTEEKKRAAVAASIDLHRRKGTIGAVRKALSALGYEVEINERTGLPYVFRIEVDASIHGMSGATYTETERIAIQQKNARSHLGGIDAVLTGKPLLSVAAVECDGQTTTVEPAWDGELDASAATLYVAAGEYTVDTANIVDAKAIEWDSIPSPMRILAATDGKLYVSSYSAAKIYRALGAGIALAFASIDGGPIDFCQASDGNFYVCGYGANCIYKITPDGVVSVHCSTISSPFNIMQASDGNLYCITDTRPLVMYQITLGGAVAAIATIAYAYGGQICQASDGNLYFFSGSTSSTRRINKVTLSGVVSTLKTVGTLDMRPCLLSAGDGVMYATRGQYVYKITIAGSYSLLATMPSSQVIGWMILGSDGYLYCTTYSGAVVQVSAAGVVSTLASGLGDLRGITFGADGALYACGYANSKVYRITLAGTVTEYIP